MTIMGIDIGGSGIKGAPVNIETGEIIDDRFRLPTPNEAKPDDVAETVTDVLKHFNWSGPVGIGFPSVVRNGITYTAANIHKSWIETNAEQLFTQVSGCPVYVINDADAAGIAEMQFGVGQEHPSGVAIMITIGTGLGTAVFVDRKLVPNTELGHIEIRGKDAESRASDAARQRKDLNWEEWGGRFNEYLNYLERLFWPDIFILGGGTSKMFAKFIPYIHVHAEVVPARLLNQAGMVGAALYAAKRSGKS